MKILKVLKSYFGFIRCVWASSFSLTRPFVVFVPNILEFLRFCPLLRIPQQGFIFLHQVFQDMGFSSIFLSRDRLSSRVSRVVWQAKRTVFPGILSARDESLCTAVISPDVKSGISNSFDPSFIINISSSLMLIGITCNSRLFLRLLHSRSCIFCFGFSIYTFASEFYKCMSLSFKFFICSSCSLTRLSMSSLFVRHVLEAFYHYVYFFLKV